MKNITIQHAMESSAKIRIRCVGCGRVVDHTGPRLIARLGKRETPLRTIQRQTRCQKCGGLGELILTFPDVDIEARKTKQPAEVRYRDDVE